MKAIFLLASLMFTSLTIKAAVNNSFWTFIGNEINHPFSDLDPADLPSEYSIFILDSDAFNQSLTEASTSEENAQVSIPTPEGTENDVIYWKSEVMHPDLAEQFQDIKPFQGFDAFNHVNMVRFDTGPLGFHALADSQDGQYYISPLGENRYIVFYAKHFRTLTSFDCISDKLAEKDAQPSVQPFISYGSTKRTYRLAVAATGEYTQATGGTVATSLASIVTAVNFINGIYERDIGVRLQLVANNSSIIYTNSLLDPYTPTLGNSSMLLANQTNTDLVIGAANYDIGHVVHNLAGTGNSGSGVATLNSTCRVLSKARGVSTATRIGQVPVNPFFHRVLIHEIGHQLGAHHSFNSSCNNNRTDATAYEPGGGSTIMSYAGGCSPYNVQTLSDMYFHRINLEEIATFLSGTGGTCGTVTSTSNAIPSVEAGASYTIPRSTPFALAGIAMDANGNPLTYSWEQYNNEIAVMPPQATSPSGPNFRSFVPSTSPVRYFPRLPDILANVSPIWEVLPSVSRTMTFSLVVRDGLGGVASDNTFVTVAGTAGPFVVTAPNGGEVRRASTVVTWNTASTNLAPVNTQFVDILLSLDNGATFSSILANNTPNDGNQTVTLPAISNSSARIQVRAEANIFFDVSNAPFTITP